VKDRPYEQSVMQKNCSAVLPCCNAEADNSSLFCSELVALVYMRVRIRGDRDPDAVAPPPLYSSRFHGLYFVVPPSAQSHAGVQSRFR
jgi:hypothetical protein